MSSVKKIIKKYLPEAIKKILLQEIKKNKLKKEKKLIENQIQINKDLEEKLKLKSKIKVAFFVIHNSVWKFDNLYKMMQEHPKFEPVIVVCPYMIYGYERMIKDLEETEKVFKFKGYNYINTYNKKLSKWVDIKKEINPDIIFFTNPYETLTKDEYYITNFKEVLSCYTNYGFNTCSEYEMVYDTLFQNLLWKKFEETPVHLNLARKHSRVQGKNSIYTGYSGTEIFLSKEKINSKIWKDDTRKKIIWAPHHTLTTDSLLNWSTFEKYSDFMLEVAEKYVEKIQIIFKPHPILKSKLYMIWGKNKTDEYYKKWEQGKNTSLAEGPYEELFLTSDAMIHDCGSFSVEYLYTLNPVCRLINEEKRMLQSLNEFGKMVYNLHYKAIDKNQIIEFIEMLIKEKDILKNAREDFYNENLICSSGMLPSQKIMKELEKYV